MNLVSLGYVNSLYLVLSEDMAKKIFVFKMLIYMI